MEGCQLGPGQGEWAGFKTVTVGACKVEDRNGDQVRKSLVEGTKNCRLYSKAKKPPKDVSNRVEWLSFHLKMNSGVSVRNG